MPLAEDVCVLSIIHICNAGETYGHANALKLKRFPPDPLCSVSGPFPETIESDVGNEVRIPHVIGQALTLGLLPLAFVVH